MFACSSCLAHSLLVVGRKKERKKEEKVVEVMVTMVAGRGKEEGGTKGDWW